MTLDQVPKPVHGKPRAGEFVFARLRYDSGDWDYNPKVAANVLNSVVEYTNIKVYPEEVVITASAAGPRSGLAEAFIVVFRAPQEPSRSFHC